MAAHDIRDITGHCCSCGVLRKPWRATSVFFSRLLADHLPAEIENSEPGEPFQEKEHEGGKAHSLQISDDFGVHSVFDPIWNSCGRLTKSSYPAHP